MNAIELLVAQHRQLEKSFAAILDAPAAERAPLFEAAADLLLSHVLIEERLFFPAVLAQRTEDILLESLEEHLSLKRLVCDLLGLSPQEPPYEAKVKVLSEQAEHHHEEEEKNLFPKVKKLLASDELDALGAEMEQRQKELLVGAPRQLACAQTDQAATLPAST